MEKGFQKLSLHNLRGREKRSVLCVAPIKHLLWAVTEQMLDGFQVWVRTGEPGRRSVPREEQIDMQLTV